MSFYIYLFNKTTILPLYKHHTRRSLIEIVIGDTYLVFRAAYHWNVVNINIFPHSWLRECWVDHLLSNVICQVRRNFPLLTQMMKICIKIINVILCRQENWKYFFLIHFVCKVRLVWQDQKENVVMKQWLESTTRSQSTRVANLKTETVQCTIDCLELFTHSAPVQLWNNSDISQYIS